MSKDILPEVGRQLTAISASILYLLQTMSKEEILDLGSVNRYRDAWERIPVYKSFFASWRQDSVINIDELAVEVITTANPMSEIHHHNDAYAFVTLLGEREGYNNPVGGCYYFGDAVTAHKAVPGISLHVLPGIIHGFRPSPGNDITILSVQSKRIDDDFYPD